MRKLRVKSVAFVVALTAFSVAGMAFAAWITSGSGSATAKAGSAVTLTTSASATSTATLYPGGAAGDAFIKVNNPNSFPVTVNTVTGSGAITADAGHAACTTTGVTFTNATGLSIAVGAGASTDTTLTGKVSMDNTSLNACQGATFTIPVTIAGVSG